MKVDLNPHLINAVNIPYLNISELTYRIINSKSNMMHPNPKSLKNRCLFIIKINFEIFELILVVPSFKRIAIKTPAKYE